MKLIGCLGFVLLLTACSNKSYELMIKESITVGTYSNTCDLVLNIDGVQVEDRMITDSNILVGDLRVICPGANLNTLGDQTLSYSINGTYINKNVSITDDIPPELMVLGEYEVEVGNDYFDLKSEVVAKDNFSEDITIIVSGVYNISKVGVYTVSVSAQDSSGNIDKKEVTINVIEKEKEIIVVTPHPTTKPTSKPGNQGSGQVAPGETGNSGGETSGNVNKPTSPFINGVKDIQISKDVSIHDLTFLLQSGISASASLSIDYAEVNLSVAGSYKVYYYADDGATASCTVTVQ